MLRQAQDLLQEFEKDDEARSEPNSEQLQALSDTLQASKRKVIQECSQKDPLTGQAYVRADSDKYKVLVQKENDKFRMETGYEAEYITQLIQNSREAMMKYFEEAIRAERQRQATSTAAAVPSAGSPKKERARSDEEWSDVDEEDDVKVSKTVELA